jgi:hypothetical protein
MNNNQPLLPFSLDQPASPSFGDYLPPFISSPSFDYPEPLSTTPPQNPSSTSQQNPFSLNQQSSPPHQLELDNLELDNYDFCTYENYVINFLSIIDSCHDFAYELKRKDHELKDHELNESLNRMLINIVEAMEYIESKSESPAKGKIDKFKDICISISDQKSITIRDILVKIKANGSTSGSHNGFTKDSVNNPSFKKSFFDNFILPHSNNNLDFLDSINNKIIRNGKILSTFLKNIFKDDFKGDFDEKAYYNDIMEAKTIQIADIDPIEKNKYIKYRNLSYYIMFILKSPNDERIVTLYELISIFNLIYELGLVLDSLDNLKHNIHRAYVKAYDNIDSLINEFDNITYPSSYIFDQGKNFPKYQNRLYNWLLFDKKNIDQGPGLTESSSVNFNKIHKTIMWDLNVSSGSRAGCYPDYIVGSLLDKNISYSIYTKENYIIYEYNWLLNEDNKILCKKTNLKTKVVIEKLQSEYTDYTEDRKRGRNDSDDDTDRTKKTRRCNKYYIISGGDDDKDDEANAINKIVKLITSNPESIIELTGFKRFGDWYQCLYSQKYNLLFSSEDFWANMFAIFIKAPIIIGYEDAISGLYTDYLFNIIKTPEDPSFKTSTDSKIYIKPNVKTRCKKAKEIKDNLSLSDPKFMFSYDTHMKNGKVIVSTKKVQISKSTIPFIINKYLKYKLKYIKKKSPHLEFTKAIENERKKLMNDKNVNYNSLYQKYIKYKNKYIKLII